MKFRTKLTISITLLTSLLYGIGGTLLISLSFYGSLKLEQNQALQAYRFMQSALTLANTIGEQDSPADMADILRGLDQPETNWEALRLYDKEKIFYQSNTAFTFDTSLRELCTENRCAIGLFKTSQEHFLQITGTFYIEDDIFYLDTAKNISALYALREMHLQIYRILFLVVAALSAVLSFVTAHFLTGPLRHLSRVSRELAQGALEKRANIQSGDEMEALSKDFNSMAENLTQKIQELEEAMQQQERFMGSFAHELKTPMTSLIGYADLLRSCTLTKTEQLECAEYIFKEGKRLEQLSFQLLDLIVLKRKDFPLLRTNPAALLINAMQLIKEKLKHRNILFTFETEDGCCMLAPDLVQSLLLNLLDNAGNAIQESGRIHAKQTMSEEGCRFEISDDGKGIPKEELDKITEAFYRVDKSRSRKHGGAGLGLSLCKEIAALHNGTITFISEPGTGTKVIVELRGESV